MASGIRRHQELGWRLRVKKIWCGLEGYVGQLDDRPDNELHAIRILINPKNAKGELTQARTQNFLWISG
jgi:hypothetical protein